MEVNSEIFANIEIQTEHIFRSAGWNTEIVTDYERIDKIVERALLEHVMRDTSTFVFKGFGAALTGLSAAFFGSAIHSESNYRA